MLTMNMENNPVKPSMAITVIIACLAANVVVGMVVRKIGLPIYLDTIGTVLATVVLGWRWGLVAAFFSVVLGSFLIWPQYFYYSATAVGIVAAVEICYRYNMFTSPLRSSWSGLVVAIIAAILSAPVTAYFSASTLSGNDLITALFRNMGNSLWESIFLSGFSSEPVDKVITCLVVYWTIQLLPNHVMGRYHLRGIR